MSSNQRKGDVKLATLQKSLVKVVAGALYIFTEVQKDKFNIQTIAQMVAVITATVGKVSYDLSFLLYNHSLGHCVQQIMNLQNYCLGTISQNM